MIHQHLLKPKSIAIIGASNNLESPGGKVLFNLIQHRFSGTIYPVNPREKIIQGLACHQNLETLEKVDLAIIAIAAKYTLETVKILTREKGTRGFIIFSAGFSETSEQGALLEKEITQEINAVGGSLLGPNNIGLINNHYTGVFTTPIPNLNPSGVDFISGSGATAVFIIEAAMSIGLPFSSVYSVGNSAQLGIEELLEHLDTTYDAKFSSKVKLLYIEHISDPKKLLKHSRSLRKKGCKIAAIKAGSSDEGSRAASSHTGALASSDVAVDALLNKAGIIRCYGRNELVNVASILLHPVLKGKNLAIITHAGGPAVMLTDTLSKNGFKIPELNNEHSEALKKELFPGSSVSNPIDFLATGTAEQLGIIIDYCDNYFDEIDAIAVIFGSPGLFRVHQVYDLLHEKMNTCSKPIFPILPSVVNVKEEINTFISKGRMSFPDEVLFGNALGKVYYSSNTLVNSPKEIADPPEVIKTELTGVKNGYLPPEKVKIILESAGLHVAREALCTSFESCYSVAADFGYPLVMKAVGPVHKSDIGAIVLNINNVDELKNAFNKLIQIENVSQVMLQPMLSGTELFIGAKKEAGFGHLILAGLGGIYIEVLKDFCTGLAPVSADEALEMIKSLKSYKIIKGMRNQAGVNEVLFAAFIEKISRLTQWIPEIAELDLNPLIATENDICVVDARIRIESPKVETR